MAGMSIFDRWKRRSWRRDDTALAALTGSRPAIVITGGSDGIGLALAKSFARPECTVILVARDQQRLDAALDELRTAGHSNIETLAQDVTAPDAIGNIKAFLAGRDYFADILINSAGMGTTGAFVEEAEERLTALTDLNVTALSRLTRALLPDMLVRGRGGIVNVASLGGFAPGPYQAAYYASKAYVLSLTRALASETRGQGVRIAAIAPGPVNTEFHARADAETSLYRRVLPAMSPEQIAASARRGYDFGHELIIPGIFNNLMGLIMRVLPSVLVTPIVGVLLKPREQGDDQGGATRL